MGPFLPGVSPCRDPANIDPIRLRASPASRTCPSQRSAARAEITDAGPVHVAARAPSEFRVLAFLGGDEVGIISSYWGHSSIGKNRTLRSSEGGGGKPRHGDALETRRFWSVSSRLKAWRNTLVSRHVLSPGDNASPFLDASSVLATRLSVQFRPFRGVTPTSSNMAEETSGSPPRSPPIRTPPRDPSESRGCLRYRVSQMMLMICSPSGWVRYFNLCSLGLPSLEHKITPI